MKYTIIGAGGTGGSLGGFLAAAGKDVTLIARGAHLEAMQKNGLTLHSGKLGELHLPSIRATTMEAYHEKADCIFVAVKGYSLESVVPFLETAANPDTIIIPILNIYGVGKALAKRLPHLTVLEGCIYIVAYISAPGHIVQSGKTFRVVYGTRGKTRLTPRLKEIEKDLAQSKISAVVSEDIAADTFRKFTFVSPLAAAGAYYDIAASKMQADGKERDTFKALVKEAIAVAKSQDIQLPEDQVEKNLAILDAVEPDTTASMQKDLKKGGQSEIDGLIFEVVRWAKASGVPVPTYRKIAERFGFSLV